MQPHKSPSTRRPPSVAVVDPDRLVACVAMVTDLHEVERQTADTPDIIVLSAAQTMRSQHHAIAACARIKALVWTMILHAELVDRYRGSTPEHLPPETLVRAAAIAPLKWDSEFCVKAFERAILKLIGAEGRA